MKGVRLALPGSPDSGDLSAHLQPCTLLHPDGPSATSHPPVFSSPNFPRHSSHLHGFISVLPKGPRPLPENSSSPFLPHPLGLSMASSDIFEFHRLSALCGIFFFSNLQELAVRYFSNCFLMKTTSHVLYSPHPMAFSLIHWAFIGLPFFSGQPWCLVF